MNIPNCCPHCLKRPADLNTHIQFNCPVLNARRYTEHEQCDFDYKTLTLDAGTYCRTHRRYHYGV